MGGHHGMGARFLSSGLPCLPFQLCGPSIGVGSAPGGDRAAGDTPRVGVSDFTHDDFPEAFGVVSMLGLFAAGCPWPSIERETCETLGPSASIARQPVGKTQFSAECED